MARHANHTSAEAQQRLKQYRSALRWVPNLHIRSMGLLAEGSDNIAFLVNETLVVRIAKHHSWSAERDASVLRFVHAASPLPTPEVSFHNERHGVLAYKLLPGRR